MNEPAKLNDYDAPAGGLSAQGGAVVLAVLVLACILPGLFMGIHADDWFQIRPRSASEVLAAFSGDWNQGVRGQGGFYRPVVRSSFAIDASLYGLAPWGYHLTNGVIFAALLLCLYKVGLLLFPGRRIGVLFILTIVLAANPLKNEALYWLSGRTDLLAATFVLWAFHGAIWALGGNRWRAVFGCHALLVLGLLSKEVALAGCLVIPLTALLLGRQTTWRSVRGALVAGPAVLAALYMVYRSAVLGGLAGYTTQSSPRTIGDLFLNVSTMASALANPWQSAGASVYTPMYAWTGIGFVLLLIALTGFRRGAIAAFAAVIVCLMPMVFLRISPPDGNRVLLLGLSFEVVMFYFLFLGEGTSRWFVRGIAFVAAAAALSLQPANMSIIRDFLVARRPNTALLDAAWQYVDKAPDDTVLLVPRKGVTRTSRRILDPGEACLMAMETRWLLRPGASSRHVAVSHAPALYLELAEPGRRLRLVQVVQPWMERAAVLHFTDAGKLEAGNIQQIKTEIFSKSDLSEEPPHFIPLQPAGDGIIATETIAGESAGRETVLVREDHKGRLDYQYGIALPVDGITCRWIGTSDFLAEPPTTNTLVINAGSSRLQLRSVRLSTYTLEGIDANASGGP